MPSKPPRKTLLIISQVYVPDPAAVGQHIADVAEAMAAKGWRVIVYTSRRGYENPAIKYPTRDWINGVDVRRLPLSSFGKRSIAVRLLAQAAFMLQAMIRGMFTSRLSAVLVSTSPPFAGVAGVVLRTLRRVPFVWWVMDLNPDQLVVAKAITADSLAVRLFDQLNRVTMRQATHVIALDRFMADRLLAKDHASIPLVVIPPWAPAFESSEGQITTADFRIAHKLEDSFVVAYSGNHALQHPLGTVLEAARYFEHEHEVLFVFIGGGAGKAAVDARVEAGAPNIRSLPFQPLADIRASLGAVDVHIVSMGNDVVGIVHPCKIYGVLAIGRPILFFGPLDSHIGDIMTSHRLGEVVEHGDIDGAVRAIRRLRALSASDTAQIRANCATIMDLIFNRQRSLAAVCEVLEAASEPQS